MAAKLKNAGEGKLRVPAADISGKFENVPPSGTGGGVALGNTHQPLKGNIFENDRRFEMSSSH